VHRSYEIGGTLLGVRTNSAGFGEWLDRHLGRLAADEELPPYYSVFVGIDHLPGTRFHVLYEDTRPIARSTDLREIGFALVRELEKPLFGRRDDAVYALMPLVSAAGATGLLPPGLTPLIGTLGRQVERAGLELPLEFAVAIDVESALVTPIRPLLGVRGAALAELSSNGGSLRRILGQQTPVNVIFSIGSDEELLTPVSKGIGLYRLAHYTANLPAMGKTGFEALGRLVARADCVELRGDDRRTMLGAIVTALTAQARPSLSDGGEP
jgi:hypothetical protein